MPKKRLSDDEKVAIALAALQQKETVAEICNRFSICETTLYRIRDQALASLPEAMKRHRGGASAREARLEKETVDLKELIADQACAIQILKKKLPRSMQ